MTLREMKKNTTGARRRRRGGVRRRPRPAVFLPRRGGHVVSLRKRARPRRNFKPPNRHLTKVLNKGTRLEHDGQLTRFEVAAGVRD